MSQYLDDPSVAQLWQEEQARGSYYGLTFEVIVSGANRKLQDEAAPSRTRLAA